MRAAVLDAPRMPLAVREVPDPSAGRGMLLLRVRACGVCRTDLHIVDSELEGGRLPVIPGHQIVGTVVRIGNDVRGFSPGDRVGVSWLGSTCGSCPFCLSGRENLCDRPSFTGFHVDGGFAELTAADARYCFPVPEGFPDLEAAPLLCAGLIGYRSLRMVGAARKIGFYGFGSAAHIILQAARFQGREIYAFTRAGDARGQAFARELGAAWAGDSSSSAPEPLDAAIIFAPVGALVPAALAAVAKGGVVVCAGIHMSDIPSFPYRLLWEERTVRSVANLTRQDAEEFLALAPRVPIRSRVETFALNDVNLALAAVRDGRLEGSAVIDIAR
jgi:propanol-preferring alcohol dehydrogenase